MCSRLLAGFVGLCVLLGGSVQAQSGSDVTIEAQAIPSEVGTAETVTVEIRIEGASLSDVETPDPPRTSNLVLQGSTPSTERDVSFDSGHFTRRVTLEWRYQPMQVGIGRIRPVTVRIRGERYTTDEMRVRIVPQSQRSGAASASRADPTASPSASRSSSRATLGPRDLFIRATASAETAYQNEQVTVEYRLFFRPGVRLRQSRLADAWDAPGFWREELDVASRPTPRSTTMYGQTYEAIVLKRVALFPTRVGTLSVDPLRIETEAQARGSAGRRNRGGRSYQYEPVTLASEEVSVTAEPLPPDAPRAFDGAVGQFTLDTNISADSVEVGNAVDLTARLQGTGNIATVSPPVVDPPSDFETYEPSVRADIDRSGDAVHGSKTFTYTLVPRSNGRYTLPPVAFAYFDPERKRYEVVRSEPVALHVTGDVPPMARSQTGQGLPVGEIAGLVEDDVHWVQTDRAPLYRQPWAYAILLIPFMLAAGGIAYRHYAQGAPGPVEKTEGLSAAQDHLREAHRHLRDGDTSTFYQTVERAVLAFVATRLDLAETPSGLTREALDRHLSRYDVPEADREALHELLDACDQAQFTPAEPSHDAMEATLDHAQTLLLRLDESTGPGERA